MAASFTLVYFRSYNTSLSPFAQSHAHYECLNQPYDCFLLSSNHILLYHGLSRSTQMEPNPNPPSASFG